MTETEKGKNTLKKIFCRHSIYIMSDWGVYKNIVPLKRDFL